MRKKCGKIDNYDINKNISCYGWISKYRNIGKIIFINIRDNTGFIQVVFNNTNKKIFSLAQSLRNEFCIKVSGFVKKRSQNNRNLNVKTGKFEIYAKKLKIYNKSKKFPFNVDNKKTKKINLKFRYLDIRINKKIIKNLKTKNKVIHIITNFMYKNKFLNVETPVLTKSTPEGARDYLVPSRIKKKNFYALPQSPQIFKQLLMIGGIDKYYQIAKCFRDEDLRSNRQPEFTQIDLESSFVNSKKIIKISEKIIHDIWLKTKNVKLKKIPRISFKKSIKKFGSEKPDLRCNIKLINLKKIFQHYSLKKNFKHIISLKFPKGSNVHINILKKFINFFKKNKINNITFIKIKNFSLKKFSIFGEFSKFLRKSSILEIINKHKSKNKDLIFLASNNKKNIYTIFGEIRNKIINVIRKKKSNKWSPIWITKFPLFKKKKNDILSSMHHPFTAPLKKYNIKDIKNNPEKIISDSYDLIINGHEIGGGSVRINNRKMQELIFKMIGINSKKQKKSFNFFLKALEYGTPPHAGIAFGLDRIIMLLNNTKNIKNTIAFPKNTSSVCKTTNAPNKIKKTDLNDFGLKFL
ncbi:aspartate--tRNA ligase [Buchnera aphidicola]|uniref:aspartate--tRNA ligase n=1 Tax=Buchnera aphidicola TaxID=9 RepID=UPI0030EC0076